MGAVGRYMGSGGGTKAAPKEGSVIKQSSATVKTIHERRLQLTRMLKGQTPDPIQSIASTSRVLILEGISGSGKDTFQQHLRMQLKNRDIYEYSEGEVLQSWTHLPIKGIHTLQIKFLKLFVKHMKSVLTANSNAVFLINRFHLSAYVAAVMKQPRLSKEYNECLDMLRSMPVHVFILHVDDAEIEQRTLHPERSDDWRRFQQDVLREEGFRGRRERYSLQQKLLFELAQKQQIPYSVVRLPMYPALGAEWIGMQPFDRKPWRMTSVTEMNLTSSQDEIAHSPR